MVIVSPTLPGVGMRVEDLSRDVRPRSVGVSDGDASLRSMEYVFLSNWVGAPAVSAPAGYLPEGRERNETTDQDEKGLVPVGIMGMGEWGSEEALLDWVEEGRGILDQEQEGGRRGGVRLPKGRERAWVDVLAG